MVEPVSLPMFLFFILLRGSGLLSVRSRGARLGCLPLRRLRQVYVNPFLGSLPRNVQLDLTGVDCTGPLSQRRLSSGFVCLLQLLDLERCVHVYC